MKKKRNTLPDDINTVEGRKRWLKGKKILSMCCFCGKGIEKDVCQFQISIDKDEKKFITWQIFWCHKKCLEKRLSKKFKDNFVLGDKK